MLILKTADVLFNHHNHQSSNYRDLRDYPDLHINTDLTHLQGKTGRFYLPQLTIKVLRSLSDVRWSKSQSCFYWIFMLYTCNVLRLGNWTYLSTMDDRLSLSMVIFTGAIYLCICPRVSLLILLVETKRSSQ